MEKELKIIEVNQKKYFLVDKINQYYYFSNLKDNHDILIFEEDEDLVSIDDEKMEYVLGLFYDKFKNNTN